MKILLAISGSISAYKAYDLTRELVKNNHQIKIVLTAGALKFVNKDVFKYLGAMEVYEALDDFKEKNVLHVDLGRWCDTFLIAPLSANTLSRLVNGSADDLLTSTFLAYPKDKPILVFPAMNTEMLSHPFVQLNFDELKKLKSLNNIFVSETNSGLLACFDEGAGKLPEIFEIIDLLETIKYYSLKNSDQHVVITTGATIAPLDPVRYLTNSSSGITGYYLAKNFLSLGHKVTVIAGKNATLKLERLIKHPQFELIRTTTVDDMYAAVHQKINVATHFIAAAAVSDIEFNYINNKVKKDSLIDNLPIKPAKDILKSVIDLKIANLKTIGFAAETDLSDSILEKKFNSKPVDLLVGTKVHNGLQTGTETGFSTNEANYRFMKSKKIIFEGKISKENLGFEILKNLL